MTDPRIVKLAHTLVHFSAEVHPGDTVILSGDVSGLPLVRETYNAILRAGGHPLLNLSDDTLADSFMRLADDAQLEWISPLEEWAVKQAKVRIFIRSTSNTRRGTTVDPQRIARHTRARAELSKIRFARAASGDQRWTLTQFPTEAYAQEADMSLQEFEDFVYGATFSDQPDPIARWRELGANQQKYVDWLKGRKDVVVRGPNIDMRLSIADRTFVNSDGRHNMPSGEIFTGPVEESVNGWVRFTYPAIRESRVVEGIELEFKDGKVIRASAKKNEAYLLSQLEADAGARYLGEWAIGTNYGINRFTGNILFDEKIGGTIHMALGRAYPETGGKNESAIHWDMICDMRDGSEITVDGDLLYKNGQFAF
jgi:aminopeptidase